MKNTFSDDIKKLQDSIQRLQQIQTPVWAEQHRELGIE